MGILNKFGLVRLDFSGPRFVLLGCYPTGKIAQTAMGLDVQIHMHHCNVPEARIKILAGDSRQMLDEHKEPWVEWHIVDIETDIE